MQRTAYNPDQLARALGWKPAQLATSRRARPIPDPDVTRPQRLGPHWSPTITRGLLACCDDLTVNSDMGQPRRVPDRPGHDDRLGGEVGPNAVAELRIRPTPCEWPALSPTFH